MIDFDFVFSSLIILGLQWVRAPHKIEVKGSQGLEDREVSLVSSDITERCWSRDAHDALSWKLVIIRCDEMSTGLVHVPSVSNDGLP